MAGWLQRVFRRDRRAPGQPSERETRTATLAHIEDFVATRVGVEVYVEPATAQTPTTVMLVATDGEWTRRRVPDPATAHRIAADLAIPCYDVQRVGYPPRVRAYNERQRRARRGAG